MSERIRTGARSFLDIMQRACKLSHMPGFQPAVRRILGPTTADPIIAAWVALCALIEAAIAADNWYNKIDSSAPSPVDNEDTAPGA